MVEESRIGGKYPHETKEILDIRCHLWYRRRNLHSNFSQCGGESFY